MVLKSPRVAVLLEVTDPGADPTREFVVQTDNRDMVRYDRTRAGRKWPTVQEAPMLWLTYVAWSALNRTGQYPGKYDDFEGECLEVGAVDADGQPLTDPTQAEPVDPTPPGHVPG